MPPERVAEFGPDTPDTPVKRSGQPEKLAPVYRYLASAASSNVTEQIIPVNGNEIVND